MLRSRGFVHRAQGRLGEVEGGEDEQTLYRQRNHIFGIICLRMNKKWLVSRPGHPVGIPLSKLNDSVYSLRDFLGYDWVKAKIQTYKAWRVEHSVGKYWNHRPPGTNPLIPMFTVLRIGTLRLILLSSLQPQ